MFNHRHTYQISSCPFQNPDNLHGNVYRESEWSTVLGLGL